MRDRHSRRRLTAIPPAAVLLGSLLLSHTPATGGPPPAPWMMVRDIAALPSSPVHPPLPYVRMPAQPRPAETGLPPAPMPEAPEAAPDSALAFGEAMLPPSAPAFAGGGEAAKPWDWPPLRPVAFPGHAMHGSPGGGGASGGPGPSSSGPSGGGPGGAAPSGGTPPAPPVELADTNPSAPLPDPGEPPPVTSVALLEPPAQTEAPVTPETVAPETVAEPASLALLGLGLLGLAATRRARRRH